MGVGATSRTVLCASGLPAYPRAAPGESCGQADGTHPQSWLLRRVGQLGQYSETTPQKNHVNVKHTHQILFSLAAATIQLYALLYHLYD